MYQFIAFQKVILLSFTLASVSPVGSSFAHQILNGNIGFHTFFTQLSCQKKLVKNHKVFVIETSSSILPT